MGKAVVDPSVMVQAGRRALLRSGLGLGALAAAELMGLGKASGQAGPSKPAGAARANLGILGTGQLPAKIKRVIHLHMMGAPSHVDMFDYKPNLIKWNNQELPSSVKGTARISEMSNGQSRFTVMAPISPYKQYGQSGRWVSDLLPHTAKIVDDLTFIYSMRTEHVNHDPAAIFLHTGFQLPGRPSWGAWVNYGLGTDNANLPSFVVMKSQGLSGGIAANVSMWGAGFLPSHYQGVEFRSGKDPVLDVSNPQGITAARRRSQLDAIDEIARIQAGITQDPEIFSKLTQYEMAYRMQSSVPQVADLSDEPEHVLAMYGPRVREPGSYARNCLLARRLVEQGVKFVQLVHCAWDDHTKIRLVLPLECGATDQPTAALIADLKQRGLLEDTLVVWGGEFGRTAYSQGNIESPDAGRDHHGGNFTMWFAGGGLKPGIGYGASDDFSYNVAENTRLTYHYQGRDFRLTDVSGEVIKGILA
jgi:hypothetical protein